MARCFDLIQWKIVGKKTSLNDFVYANGQYQNDKNKFAYWIKRRGQLELMLFFLSFSFYWQRIIIISSREKNISYFRGFYDQQETVNGKLLAAYRANPTNELKSFVWYLHHSMSMEHKMYWVSFHECHIYVVLFLSKSLWIPITIFN